MLRLCRQLCSRGLCLPSSLCHLSIHAAVNNRGQLDGSKLHHMLCLLCHASWHSTHPRPVCQGVHVLHVLLLLLLRVLLLLLGRPKGHQRHGGGNQDGCTAAALLRLLLLLLQGCQLRVAHQAWVARPVGHPHCRLLLLLAVLLLLLKHGRRRAGLANRAAKVGNHGDGCWLHVVGVHRVQGPAARHRHARRQRRVLRRQHAACNGLDRTLLLPRRLLPHHTLLLLQLLRGRRHAQRVLLLRGGQMVH